MTPSVELLLPGALLPARWLALPEIRAALATPLLARLAAAMPQPPQPASNPRALPHEPRLAEILGLPGPDALVAVDASDLPTDAHWIVQPAHLNVGMDRVTLVALLAGELSPDETAALLEAAAPTLDDAGWRMGAAGERWWLSTPTPPDVRLATPLAALGRGVETLLPAGPDARRWRRVGTEIEMAWFDHPVNVARQARNAPTVNGLWLAGRVAAPASDARLRLPHGHVLSRLADATARVALDDGLLAARLDHDPGAWAQALPAVLDRTLAPLLADLDAGRIDAIELLLTGDDTLRRATIARPGLGARLRGLFAQAPDAAALLGEPPEPEREAPPPATEPDPFDLTLPGPSWRGGRR